MPGKPLLAVDLRAALDASTGIGVYTRQLLTALAARGRFELLALAHRPPSRDGWLAENGIAFEAQPAPWGVLWQQLRLPRRLGRGDVDLFWSPLQTLPLPEYREVSKFPPVMRDMAVDVPDSIPYQALLDALLEAGPDAVQAIRLFDVYRGKGLQPGRKSLAFRVVMQHTARTMTDGEADAAMALLTKVLPRFGGRLRA